MVDTNATQAAIRAGYSPKRAGQIGNQNYKKLQNYIEAEIEKQLKKVDLTEEKVLLQLAEDRKNAVKLKQMSPAVKCTELQGKYLKMFTDKVEHSGKVATTVNIQLIPGKKKAK